MDDAIKHTCTFSHQHDIISISNTVHRHLFSDFSPLHSLTNTPWCNGLILIGTKIFVSTLILCIVRKDWPYPSVLQQTGRQAGRQTKYGWVLFPIIVGFIWVGFISYFHSLLLGTSVPNDSFRKNYINKNQFLQRGIKCTGSWWHVA